MGIIPIPQMRKPRLKNRKQKTENKKTIHPSQETSKLQSWNLNSYIYAIKLLSVYCISDTVLGPEPSQRRPRGIQGSLPHFFTLPSFVPMCSCMGLHC